MHQLHYDRTYVRRLFYVLTLLEYYGLILLASLPVFGVFYATMGPLLGVILATAYMTIVVTLYGHDFVSETYENWLDSDHTAALIKRELSLKWLYLTTLRLREVDHDH